MEPTGRDPLAGRRLGHYCEPARAAIGKGLALVPLAAPGQPAPWLRRLLEAKLQRVK